MLASIPSAIVLGVDGHPVTVEVHVGAGLPGLTIVGLPDAVLPRGARPGAGRRARRRRRLAAPAHHRQPGPVGHCARSGSGLDLAIAVGVLVANERPRRRRGRRASAFLGELGLDGSVRPVPGHRAAGRRRRHRRRGRAGGRAARRRAGRGTAWSAPVATPRRAGRWRSGATSPGPTTRPDPPRPSPGAVLDLADVRGQPVVRRALEVAAAGGHHLLHGRPAGRGQDHARQPPARAPARPRSATQAMEATRIHSAAGLAAAAAAWSAARRSGRRTTRATMVALVGGGTEAMRPGEVTWPTAACSSWTSWPSSRPTCSTPCASRWRRA